MLTPYPYQETAIQKALQLNLLLADKCGLGKSLVALEVYLRSLKGSCLWVTRKLAKLQLAEQVKGQDLEAVVHVINNPTDFNYEVLQASPIHHYVIVHYEALPKLLDHTKLFSIQWGLIVADEVHYIKNRLAKRSKALKKLKGTLRLALSATPANRKFLGADGVLYYSPSELWNIYRFLHPANFSSYHNFCDMFIQYEEKYIASDTTVKEEAGIANLAKYKQLLQQVYLQRTKEEVADFIPPITSIQIPLPLTGKQAKLYHEFKEACKRDMIVDVEGLTPMIVSNVLSMLTQLQKLTTLPSMLGSKVTGIKLEWLKEHLTNTDDSILIVSRFRDVVIHVANMLNCPMIIGNGTTYETGTKPKYIAGTIKSLAGAFNLGFLDSVIFIDSSYSTIEAEQVKDRIHRMDIKNPKTAYYLTVEGTVDYLVLNSLKKQWDVKVLVLNFIRYLQELNK